jgi:hypothetical protein
MSVIIKIKNYEPTDLWYDFILVQTSVYGLGHDVYDRRSNAVINGVKILLI